MGNTTLSSSETPLEIPRNDLSKHRLAPSQPTGKQLLPPLFRLPTVHSFSCKITLNKSLKTQYKLFSPHIKLDAF